VRDLHSSWPQLAKEEKRQIVENITDKILVGNEDISIHLCYLPSSENMTKRERNAGVMLTPRHCGGRQAASFLGCSQALHLGLFEQPARRYFPKTC
jgi:hypothetical protein